MSITLLNHSKTPSLCSHSSAVLAHPRVLPLLIMYVASSVSSFLVKSVFAQTADDLAGSRRCLGRLWNSFLPSAAAGLDDIVFSSTPLHCWYRWMNLLSCTALELLSPHHAGCVYVLFLLTLGRCCCLLTQFSTWKKNCTFFFLSLQLVMPPRL